MGGSVGTGLVLRGRYRVGRELGQGGMAHTFLAVDEHTGREVAVKQLSLERVKDWKALELFEREGRVLQELRHPAIPAYVDSFAEEGDGGQAAPRFYLVQEYVQGETLEAALERGRRFSEAEVRALLRELLGVLGYLHGLNPPVIHRDLKPSNLILRPDGGLAVIDFGAIQAASVETVSGGSTFVGTSGYMAPEQFLGKAEPATDLYALGATLVHLLARKHPADLPLVRMRLQFREYVKVSPAFAGYLERLLDPMVEERFPCAAAALEALQALDRGLQPRRAANARAPKGAAARALALAIVLLALLLAGAGVLAGLLLTVRDPAGLRPRRSRPPARLGPQEARNAPNALHPVQAAATKPKHFERDLPFEAVSTAQIQDLELRAVHSRLKEFGSTCSYDLRAELRNRSRFDVAEAKGILRLLDAQGGLVGSRTVEILADREASLRPGERRSVGATIYGCQTGAVAARLTLDLVTGLAAPERYAPSQPFEVTWDCPRPPGLDLRFALRSEEKQVFFGTNTSHRAVLELRHVAGPPLTRVKLQKRIYDKQGVLVKSVDRYALTDSVAPLEPGQVQAVMLLSYGKEPFDHFSVSVTEVR